MAYRLETNISSESNMGYLDHNGIEECYIIGGIRNNAKPQENVRCDVETLGNGKQ